MAQLSRIKGFSKEKDLESRLKSIGFYRINNFGDDITRYEKNASVSNFNLAIREGISPGFKTYSLLFEYDLPSEKKLSNPDIKLNMGKGMFPDPYFFIRFFISKQEYFRIYIPYGEYKVNDNRIQVSYPISFEKEATLELMIDVITKLTNYVGTIVDANHKLYIESKTWRTEK